MFKGLLKNEFIKLFGKKKTLIILFLFVVLSGILVAVNEETENNYLINNSPEYKIEDLELQIQSQKDYMTGLGQDENLLSEEEKRDLTDAKEYLSALEQELTDTKLAYENQDADSWREEIQLQIIELKKFREENTDKASQAYYDNEIKELQLYLDHDIPLKEGYCNTGINYYIKNIIMVAASFLAFGLILFNADCVSSEYNPGTLKFLLIQPVSRIKVLLSKYITMLFSSLGLIMITQVLFSVGVGLIKGFGSLYRPILIGTKYKFIIENGKKVLSEIPGSGHYVPSYQYLLYAVLLQALFILVMVTFIFMISTLFKSGIVSITTAISVLLGSNIIYALSSTYRKISPFIFLHFSDIESILSGSIVYRSGSLLFTYRTVIIISLLSAALFLGTSLIVFKKRDVQI